MDLRIKEICHEKGISIAKLADLIGVTRSSMTTTINKANPTIGTLEKIAKALDVDFLDLFVKKTGIDDVNGYIEIKRVIHKVKSKEDIVDLLTKI